MAIILEVFSLSWIHRIAYELFVHTHCLTSIALLDPIVWHAGNQVNSWHYRWETVAV